MVLSFFGVKNTKQNANILFPPEKIQILSSPDWTRTHAKSTSWTGASFCRRVGDGSPNVHVEPLHVGTKVGSGNLPTCKECLHSIACHFTVDLRYRGVPKEVEHVILYALRSLTGMRF